MKKIYNLFALSLFLLVICVSLISACGYHDHEDCVLQDETVVEGKVTYSDTDELVGRAQVTITCNHNGVDYTRNVQTEKYGMWKGTYFTYFPQSQCVYGDKVTVVATKNGLEGTNEDIVGHFISGECYDLDVAIVDIALVPEFGAVVGVLTVLGAVSVFFVVRRK